ncbi:MAG TPA: fatty acid desaturase family protein [Moraxellaceae bacterium]|nr:fatty acid desaturase family protein [Moraxellaceae bacterium]
MNQIVTIPDSATPVEMPPETRRKVTDLFTRDEIRQLTARSDLMGFWAVGSTWAIIAGAFALLAWGAAQPAVLAIPSLFLGLCVIAGRQLCLAILMHDASHGTLFKTKWLNDVFADWTCARPIWNDLQKYKVHHFVHHTRTGTADDTDISLVAPFPCSRASLARKFLRDLSGLTGLKFFIGRFLMDAGYVKWTVANDVVWLPREGVTVADRIGTFVRNVTPTVIVNAALFALLWASGHPWLFAAWVLAYMTPFALFVRIRSMAEHACTEKTADMFRNTRTTRAGWLARATVAPLRVHYHIEHHVMASVPYFRLKDMHRLLRQRNAVPAPPGYLEVMRIVSSQAVR